MAEKLLQLKWASTTWPDGECYMEEEGRIIIAWLPVDPRFNHLTVGDIVPLKFADRELIDSLYPRVIDQKVSQLTHVTCYLSFTTYPYCL